MTKDLIAELEAADAAISGVSIHLIRQSGGGIALAKAVVGLKAKTQEAAQRIRELESRLAIAELWIPKPPIMRTYRSDDEGRPVSRPDAARQALNTSTGEDQK